jgi:hypothetical protein
VTIPVAERVGEARAAGLAGYVLFRVLHAVQRVGDRAIAGAAAQVALQRMRKVGALRIVERGGRHDHSGSAKPALECLRVDKRLLHRMQRAVGGCKPFDCSDLAPSGTELPA